MSGGEGLLERAAAAGIQRLSIPTPFMVGRVNLYLIEEGPLTLVDTGPNSGKALDELERQLADRGHAVEDLELILLTHQHIDHTGLTEILARRSGARVAALDRLADHLAEYRERAEADDAFAEALMRRHGIEPEMALALRAMSRAFRAWGTRANVDRRLHDGERLEVGDRTFAVQHRPGHSPTDTLLWDDRRRILVAGDHLLARISSNPLISRDAGAGHDGGDDAARNRPQALVTYMDSLRATRELDAEFVLPGHGEPIADHAALIDERLAMHERRAERIYALIAQRPRTAHEIAHDLWGNVAAAQAYLTLSEVLGHVDLLLNAGRVREVEDENVVRFEAAP